MSMALYCRKRQAQAVRAVQMRCSHCGWVLAICRKHIESGRQYIAARRSTREPDWTRVEVGAQRVDVTSGCTMCWRYRNSMVEGSTDAIFNTGKCASGDHHDATRSKENGTGRSDAMRCDVIRCDGLRCDGDGDGDATNKTGDGRVAAMQRKRYAQPWTRRRQ